MTKKPVSLKAHCNRCGGRRNHAVLHSEAELWNDDLSGTSGGERYEMLRCLGCDNIKLRQTSWNSESERTNVHYFPPAIFRREPHWFADLWLVLSSVEDEFVVQLLKEIYIALQNNLPSLAAMGVRSLLETIMISKTQDQGSFKSNIEAFEKLGYVSRVQRKRLETILEAGHAAIHRGFTPTTQDVVTLLDIAEHIIETVYLHVEKVEKLKSRIPLRKHTSSEH